jgi:protein-tyrosine phosphatase
VERANGVTGGTIALELAKLPFDVQEAILGYAATSNELAAVLEHLVNVLERGGSNTDELVSNHIKSGREGDLFVPDDVARDDFGAPCGARRSRATKLAAAARSAAAGDFPMFMGFEVAHVKLQELGVSTWAPYLGIGVTGQFLLELDTHCTKATFTEYERTIYELQGMGYKVVIAHPERYDAIKREPELARRLLELGCDLQASADFVCGGRLGDEKKIGKRLFEERLYRYIASDAHCPEHYRHFAKAMAKYGEYLVG